MKWLDEDPEDPYMAKALPLTEEEVAKVLILSDGFFNIMSEGK